jgi:hypothetical protein
MEALKSMTDGRDKAYWVRKGFDWAKSTNSYPEDQEQWEKLSRKDDNGRTLQDLYLQGDASVKAEAFKKYVAIVTSTKWFNAYKVKVKASALDAAGRGPVVLVCIKGGPVSDVEQNEMSSIRKEIELDTSAATKSQANAPSNFQIQHFASFQEFKQTVGEPLMWIKKLDGKAVLRRITVIRGRAEIWLGDKVCYSLSESSVVESPFSPMLKRKASSTNGNLFYFCITNVSTKDSKGPQELVLATETRGDQKRWVQEIREVIAQNLKELAELGRGCVKWFEVDEKAKPVALTLYGGSQAYPTGVVLDVLYEKHGKAPCNILSIFGKARQGKSTLMNLLVGCDDLFKVSNRSAPCTKGVDLSLRTVNASVFAGSAEPSSSADVQVGFLDAEGMGDRDQSYDALLLTPVLLVSKVIIFNHKGGAQKNDMLELLQRLTAAAGRIQVSRTARGKIFENLHVVYRDHDFDDGGGSASGSDSDDEPDELDDATVIQNFKRENKKLRDQLLKEEDESGKGDAADRNQTRRLLLSKFESIHVWALPSPHKEIKDKKKKLNSSMINDEFKLKAREMKASMAEQLQKPRIFQSSATTSENMNFKTLGSLMEQAVHGMNEEGSLNPREMLQHSSREECTVAFRALKKGWRAALESLVHESGFDWSEDATAQRGLELTETLIRKLNESLQIVADRDIVAKTKDDAEEWLEEKIPALQSKAEERRRWQKLADESAGRDAQMAHAQAEEAERYLIVTPKIAKSQLQSFYKKQEGFADESKAAEQAEKIFQAYPSYYTLLKLREKYCASDKDKLLSVLFDLGGEPESFVYSEQPYEVVPGVDINSRAVWMHSQDRDWFIYYADGNWTFGDRHSMDKFDDPSWPELFRNRKFEGEQRVVPAGGTGKLSFAVKSSALTPATADGMWRSQQGSTIYDLEVEVVTLGDLQLKVKSKVKDSWVDVQATYHSKSQIFVARRQEKGYCYDTNEIHLCAQAVLEEHENRTWNKRLHRFDVHGVHDGKEEDHILQMAAQNDDAKQKWVRAIPRLTAQYQPIPLPPTFFQGMTGSGALNTATNELGAFQTYTKELKKGQRAEKAPRF